MENKESHCIDEAASDAVLNSENTDSQEDIDNFVKAQKSENTVKKTTSDMNNFYRYLAQINKRYVNILNLQAKELDHLLSKFFKDFRKVNGEEYEPDTFSGFKEASKDSSLIANRDITSSSTESLKSHVRFLLPNAKNWYTKPVKATSQMPPEL